VKKWILIVCAALIALPGIALYAGDEGAAPAEGAADPPAEEKPVDRKAVQKELRTIGGELGKITRTLKPLLEKIDEDPEVVELKKAYEDKVKEKLAAEGEDKAGLFDKKNELEKKKAELTKLLWKRKPPRKKPAAKKPREKKPAGEKKAKKDKPPKKKDEGGGDAGGGDAGGGDAGGGDWGDGW
jgi:hypothetical protein